MTLHTELYTQVAESKPWRLEILCPNGAIT